MLTKKKYTMKKLSNVLQPLALTATTVVTSFSLLQSYLIGRYTPLRATLPFLLFLSAIGAAPAFAETFVVDGNKALNTNNNFSKVDGNPRMSIWDFNPNDADQQFDRLQGMSGSTLLKHRSTGKCLNAYYLNNGGVVATWSCNPNDPAQNFNVIPVGGGYSLIQRRGSNFCVDSPTRNNYGKIQLWDCNPANPNQRWQNGSNPPPVQPPVQPPVNQIQSQRKVNDFVSQWNGKTGITRYDPSGSGYNGQCVTLIARYLQDHYGASKTNLAIGNGADVAYVVGNNFSSFIWNTTADPKPGSIMSFPALGGGYGHVALVVNAQRSGTNLNVQILDSNSDNAGANSVVKLHNITIDTRSWTAPGYGSVLYSNPRD